MFMVGSILRFGSFAVWVFHIIACMGNGEHLLAQIYLSGSRFRLLLLIWIISGVGENFSIFSSGCLGCDNRPQLMSSLDKPLKTQNIDDAWKDSKPIVCEDFWATSTCEMDNNLLQSCGSISLTSTLTQTHDALGAGCSTKPSEFVNHGLIQWDQSRSKWIGNKKTFSRAKQRHEPNLSWDATYDSLLSSNKPFRKPIPLAEMVDFLVDIWEQEGMYG